MIVHNCAQLSDEWFELHKGRLTASRADRIITAKQAKPSASIEDLACELVAEKLSLIPPIRKPTNGPMQDGIDREPEARTWLEFDFNCDIEQIGFVMTDDGRFGCSPDGIVTAGGKIIRGWEIKCPQPKQAVQWAVAGVLPDEHKAQVHMSMSVCELDHWIFASYCPPFSFHVRVERDAFTDSVEKCMGLFWDRYTEILARFTTRSAA